MSRTSDLVDFLTTSDQLHVPSMRFALRSVVGRKAYGDHLQDDEDQLLQLVGRALIWHDDMIVELWMKFKNYKDFNFEIDLHNPDSLRSLLRQHGPTQWHIYKSEVLALWQREPHLVKCVMNEALLALNFPVLRHLGQHPNLEHVASLYCLSPLEKEILECVVTAHQWPRFREFLKYLPMSSMVSTWEIFSSMVGCTAQELQVALEPTGRLRSSDLVILDRAPNHMEEFVRLGPVADCLFLIHAASRDALRAKVLNVVEAPVLKITDFPHLSDEFRWIANCLRSAIQTRAKGVNVLLQGPAGTGKTQLARLLVQATEASGIKATEITNNENPIIEVQERLERYEWTQKILQTHPGAIIVYEGVGKAANYCESVLNDRLEKCSIPTIWIADDTYKLADSVLSRFVFHLKTTPLPISARRHIVGQIAGSFVNDPSKLEAIANSTDISPAQVAMAAKFCRLSTSEDSPVLVDAFLRAVDASQRAKGRSPVGVTKSMIASDWDIDVLNLEASAPLPRILECLRRAGSASLAFHGVPGTGKTSLAAHIANMLDRPLFTRRVSDLASKWLGETEKSIAAMFRDAESENAILFLDEADSFFRDRRLARASWEVTQVNELLQQIDSFKGIFICATNLIDDIDTAALRRFTFKIKFLALDDRRRQRMLASYALSDANAAIPQPISDRLAALSQLAPGDFATVRRQEILINEHFSLDQWISELEREHTYRMPHAKQRAAFI